jgi:hypothetical protein
MSGVLEAVKDLRKLAKSSRDAAVLDQDPIALEHARSQLEKAIALLQPVVPRKGAAWNDADKKHAQRLYECMGSLGGTWRDAADLEADDEKKRSHWDHSIEYYDEGYRIESGTHEDYPDFEFHDSYNLLQRLVVRVLREPRCLRDGDTQLGRDLNVPAELARAERIINDQLRGPRKDDAWAMADLAMLLILGGQSRDRAWQKFAEDNRSSEAYEANHRAFAALVKSGEQGEPQPEWLPAAKETVIWLAAKLQTLYGIEV